MIEDDTRIRNDIRHLLSLTEDTGKAKAIAQLNSEIREFTKKRLSEISSTARNLVVALTVGVAVSLYYPPLFFLASAIAIFAMASVITDAGYHLKTHKERTKLHVVSHLVSAVSIVSVFVLCGLQVWDTGFVSVYTSICLGIGVLYLIATQYGTSISLIGAGVAILGIAGMTVHIKYLLGLSIPDIDPWAMLQRNDVRVAILILFVECLAFLSVGNAIAKAVAWIESAGPKLVESITTTADIASEFYMKKHQYDYFVTFLKTLQYVAGSKPHDRIGPLEVSACITPSQEISGDFYDTYIHGPSKEILVWIGDVSGKGVNAGIVMASIQFGMHAILDIIEDTTLSLSDILKRVNKLIYETYNSKIPDATYMTTMSLFSYKNGRVIFTGEHENVILLRANGDHMVLSTSDYGSFLGLNLNAPSDARFGGFEFNVGDRMILYTDGFTEQIVTKTGTELGTRAFTDIVLKNSGVSVANMCKAIIRTTKREAGVEKFTDDTTIVVIGRYR